MKLGFYMYDNGYMRMVLSYPLPSVHFPDTCTLSWAHCIQKNGIETDPEKVHALKTWPNNSKPQGPSRSFLGFTGYYCHFVKDYSKIICSKTFK